MFAEVFAQVFYNYRKIPTSWGWREAQIQAAGVLQIDFESLQFLELLDSALHLHGFGGFVAEALDELFRFLNHLLLVHVRAHLLLVPLFAQLNEPAVIDVIIVYASKCYLNGSAAHIVNERTVVADHQYCARTAFQEVLEPLNRLDVQMVCRLVEQK